MIDFDIILIILCIINVAKIGIKFFKNLAKSIDKQQNREYTIYIKKRYKPNDTNRRRNDL